MISVHAPGTTSQRTNRAQRSPSRRCCCCGLSIRQILLLRRLPECFAAAQRSAFVFGSRVMRSRRTTANQHGGDANAVLASIRKASHQSREGRHAVTRWLVDETTGPLPDRFNAENSLDLNRLPERGSMGSPAPRIQQLRAPPGELLFCVLAAGSSGTEEHKPSARSALAGSGSCPLVAVGEAARDACRGTNNHGAKAGDRPRAPATEAARTPSAKRESV